ncbi:FAD-dependent oxidoreductase [Pseudonocardia ailaonensis]|uniref:FAD-dependent oxidoreductase n=1 Tax=Pseudonocardia ailaonensis TaxID=367279 RepID=A0ABN2N9N3_9PSEU
MQTPFRVAVIGAGPSGLYTAAALVSTGTPVAVDVFDRLPAPFGLVRYGVAPDHLRTKSVTRALQRPFMESSGVRFLGHVPVGPAGLSAEVLREHYHAVVWASGSISDRGLGIDGETLEGSHGSGEFVSWYSGHPDHIAVRPDLAHSGAVVVGAGNVALDIARILVRSPGELASTDVPDDVLELLRRSEVSDVHIVVRRGPEHVKFTSPELRQLGALEGVDVIVEDRHVIASVDAGALERRQAQNLAILGSWADSTVPARDPGRRRVHLHFLRTPRRLVGQGGRVVGLVVERTEVRDGRLVGTGEEELIHAGLVVRAIGYRSEPIDGLPHDPIRGIVPNVGGRVVDGDRTLTGCYVTGWLKRGPTGVIGTNKACGEETAGAVLSDLGALPAAVEPDPEAIDRRLAELGIVPVVWTDWQRLDDAEVGLGRTRGGAERVKIAHIDAMLAAARGTEAAVPAE